MQEYAAPQRAPGTPIGTPNEGAGVSPPPLAGTGQRRGPDRLLDGAGEQSWHRGKQLNLALNRGSGLQPDEVPPSLQSICHPFPCPPHHRHPPGHTAPLSQPWSRVRPLWGEGQWGGGGLCARWMVMLGGMEGSVVRAPVYPGSCSQVGL